MTGSCAQRRHWSLLRAWTARSLAVAGLTGGAWLLGAGLATAAPSAPQTHLATVLAVAVTAPAVDAGEPEPGAAIETPQPESAAAEAGSAAVTAAETDTAPLHDESPAANATGRPIEVAELVGGIASDVHSRLGPVGDPEVPGPVESSLTEPDADAPRPAERLPDTALDAPRRSEHAEAPHPTAPHLSEPVPQSAPAAAPAAAESQHFAEGTGTDHATQDRGSPANHARGDRGHPPTSTPQPVPPICPPAAPVATATAAPTGPGHGLRWMHAILPTQPCLPGPVRAAGGHVETIALRGIALIEPSASPD
ncbi:hypothetical protein OOZ19_01110 [Saccharopolyspora sp. NFXS83]|uniref:hypothetical protein n=1 Tax=Saccharopolyspora sp. NFXS83 TaxID=2993560 RepID=UPI00224AA2E9|nr:hypothetical protein [Saccharopolyspora sp. NFXS83]MCX2728827.1 hypothetical protein [Saccharopolyspora sp. NFXS83]